MNINIKRIILAIIILFVCANIFRFSAQNSNQSSSTSGKVINTIININPRTKSLDEKEKNKIKENLTKPIRKMAHFSIYTVLGILVMMFAETYDIKNIRKFLFSLGFGAMYACTDEFHQIFVPGRSAEITDVLIDSCGVLLGIIIIYSITGIIEVTKNTAEKKKMQ